MNFKENFIQLILVVLLISACSENRIDASSNESYQETIKAITEGLSKEMKDSLASSIMLITFEKGLLKADMKAVDGLSKEEIFAKAERIREKRAEKKIKEQARKDSIRQIEINDSIAKFEKQGNWDIDYFVDEFNKKTDEAYLVMRTEGSFSNSVTSNSKLLAKLLMNEKEVVQIFLYEYGDNPVKSVDTKQYNVKIKGNDSVVFNENCFLIKDRIICQGTKLAEVLKMEENSVFRIESLSKYNNAVYIFDVNSKNTVKAIDILK